MMWWWRTRWRKAMRVADGLEPPDPRLAPEVRAFRDLSDLVRAAASPDTAPLPPFDVVWSGVERRLCEPEPRPRFSGLRGLLERRPLLVLAPVGTVIVAGVIALLWWTRPVPQSNQCFVDSYEVDSGSVLIDQDPDRPERPTIIWHDEEG